MTNKSFGGLRAAVAVLAVALVICPQFAGAAAGDGRAQKLDCPSTRDLRAVGWRPVTGDSYALITGNSGTVLQWTGRFFINLSPNITADLNGVGWHPSGSSALIAGERGTVLEYDGNSFRTLSTGTSSTLQDVKWRPQGDVALVAGHNGTLLRYDGNAFTIIATDFSATIVSVSWRPDGRYAFLCGDYSFVARYDPESGEVLRLSTGSDQYLRTVAWRPDGNRALVIGTLGTVLSFDGTTFVPLDSPTANQFLSVAYSPDNATAVLTARGGLMYQFTETGMMKKLETNTTESLFSSGYTLNGSYALSVGDRGTVLRFPPSVATNGTINPPDNSATLLMLSAVIMMVISVGMLCVSVYYIARAKKTAEQFSGLGSAEATIEVLGRAVEPSRPPARGPKRRRKPKRDI